jgi:hypothetical protein
MFRLIMEAGPLIFPIVFLVPVIGLLTMWNAVALIARIGSIDRRRQSIDSVLFWGALAVVLGFLGQWLGIFKIAEVIAAHGIVSPTAVAYGISESLLTPVAGMFVLMIAVLVWGVLRLGLWGMERGSRGGGFDAGGDAHATIGQRL